ncbi:hypothetical protein MSSD1_183 [Mycoplasmopsis synoviae]
MVAIELILLLQIMKTTLVIALLMKDFLELILESQLMEAHLNE